MTDRELIENSPERKTFEEWYACHAFDYVANPIGSRNCGLQWKAWEARAALAAPAVPEGYVLVPVEPSPGKLMSMAIRHDHGLGLPGYYDQLDGFFGNGVSHQQRLESIIGQMRQLHEEVVGSGFYSVEEESDYAMIAASKGKE